MNTKVVLIALVLYFKLSADSEELTQKKSDTWNRYFTRKLLDIYADTVDCVLGKTRYKGKCLTNEQIKIIRENENLDDSEHMTPDFDDDIIKVMNATNETDIVSTSGTDQSKETDTISTTPVPNSDGKENDKKRTNLFIKSSTESIKTITTIPNDEQPKTYPTDNPVVPSGPTVLEGGEVSTTTMPNDEVKKYVVAIFAAAVGIFLLLGFWCLYTECHSGNL